MINVIVPVVEDADCFAEFLKRESEISKIENNSSVKTANLKVSVKTETSSTEKKSKSAKISKKAKASKNETEKHISFDTKFFVGVTKDLAEALPKLENVEMHVFENGSNCEEIINALCDCQLDKDKILIVRRPLESQEFAALKNSKKDICVLKQKPGKFRAWLRNLGLKIVKKFFAFTFFQDISAISYGANMFELMSVCANVSMASRVNKYVGVEIEEIETAQKPVKKNYNKFVTWLIFTLLSLFLVGTIAGSIVMCLFVKINLLVILLVILWWIVAIMFWFAGLVNFSRTLAVGNLRYGKAKEVTQN